MPCHAIPSQTTKPNNRVTSFSNTPSAIHFEIDTGDESSLVARQVAARIRYVGRVGSSAQGDQRLERLPVFRRVGLPDE